jgi:hypothetical protein
MKGEEKYKGPDLLPEVNRRKPDILENKQGNQGNSHSHEKIICFLLVVSFILV